MGVNLKHNLPAQVTGKPASVDVVYDSPDSVENSWEEGAAMETEKEAQEIAGILSDRGYAIKVWAVNADNWQVAVERMEGQVIFNMVEEETLGNEVLAFWEDNGRLVTGANLKGNTLSWDKGKVRRILKQSGLPGLRYGIFSKPTGLGKIRFPVVVKSACDHGSFSITGDSVVNDTKKLAGQINWITENIGGKVLVEEYIDGRELQVTVMGNQELLIFPAKEIIFGNTFRNRPKILTYEAKWKTQSREFSDTNTLKCPAKITHKQKLAIERIVTRAYHLLEGRDLARFDIRLKRDEPIIIDYNANPDLSLCRVPAEALGWEYADFIEMMVAVAWQRRNAGRLIYKPEPEVREFAMV